jgi:hypothetical protein
MEPSSRTANCLTEHGTNFMHETSSSMCEASGRAMHPGLSTTLRAMRGGKSCSQAQPFRAQVGAPRAKIE